MEEQVEERVRKKEGGFLSRHITFSFVAMTILFFLILIFYAKTSADNSARISDIQNSRVYSCQQTYLGIQQVFKSFLPQGPRTAEQQEGIDKFYVITNNLILSCKKQTDPNK